MDQPAEFTGPVVPRRPRIYRDLLLLQLGALVFLSDQFTKFLVREFLAFRESFPAEGLFRITHTFNTGSAFSLFRDQNFPLILVAIVGITILVLIYQSQSKPGMLLRLCIGLQLGGAAGNLLDRIRLGHVTDFLDVGTWPVFNIADASIVVGLAMLAWLFLSSDRRKQQPGALAETDAGDGGDRPWSVMLQIQEPVQRGPTAAQDPVTTEEEDQISRDSTPQGSSHITQAQARSQALTHARSHREFYGPEYSTMVLVWEVVSESEGEDYYEIRLALHPAGRIQSEPFLDQFIIDKTGHMRARRLLYEVSC